MCKYCCFIQNYITPNYTTQTQFIFHWSLRSPCKCHPSDQGEMINRMIYASSYLTSMRQWFFKGSLVAIIYKFEFPDLLVLCLCNMLYVPWICVFLICISVIYLRLRRNTGMLYNCHVNYWYYIAMYTYSLFTFKCYVRLTY